MACYVEQDAKIHAVTVSTVYNLQWFSDIICVQAVSPYNRWHVSVYCELLVLSVVKFINFAAESSTIWSKMMQYCILITAVLYYRHILSMI